MDLSYINNRINNEIDYTIIEYLLDKNLLNDYKKSKSVVSQINTLKQVLSKNNCSDETISNVIDDYILHLIPAGTKGVVRGLKFNDYVEEFILKLNLNELEFEVQFEKECKYTNCLEKPDWFIYHKKSNKLLIGMNQVDLWSGGHQLNRGNKYILMDQDHKNYKLICVICNEIQLKKQNKIYKLFEYGFKNNTLCYMKNLKNIIFNYFDLKQN